MEEVGEEIKEDDPLVKKINRGSTLRALHDIGKKHSMLASTPINGKFLVAQLKILEEEWYTSSLSDISSNTNTNHDQGSVTDVSQKLSISSNKKSQRKGSNYTPSDQSKLSSKINQPKMNKNKSNEEFQKVILIIMII